ncbi:MAG: S8 family serine peptidase [Deltaproteobacteria bacterium]|nr:MAG: S8 family serine peptidase [Deltaproteobacteria bacterium]
MKRLLFLPLSFVMAYALTFLTLGGPAGCGVKSEPPTATDTALQGDWVAERLTNGGSRIVLEFGIDDQGTRQVKVMSAPVVGDVSTISYGTYSLRPNNNISFTFDSLSNFENMFSWLTPEKNRMSLGSDVYTKASTASSNGAAMIGGQVQIGSATTNTSVGVGALTLSDGQSEVVAPETAPQNPQTVTPDVIVRMRDGTVKRVMIQPQTPPAALTSSPNVSSLLSQVNQQIETNQVIQESIVHSIEELKNNPDVLSVTPNEILHTQSIDVPTDSSFADQWNMRLLNMVDAWKQTVNSSGSSLATRDVTVAVIDTGIVTSPRPADLGDRVLYDQGYDFVDDVSWSNIIECQTGSRNAVRAASSSWRDLDLELDATGRGPDNDPTDPGQASFHGTHVAGLIAAGLDNGGMVGMAGPVSRVKILPLRAMGRCGDGNLFDVAQAIYYAAKILPNMGDCPAAYAMHHDTSGHITRDSPSPGTCTATTNPRYAARPKADIINLSLGSYFGDYTGSELGLAIRAAKDAGVMIIAAAGNQQKGPGWCPNDTTGVLEVNRLCNFYPAADSTNVVAVGAVYPNLTFASGYSNFTSQTIQPHFLVAPGGTDNTGNDGVFSLTRLDDPEGSSGYKKLSGTSQATPHVTGLAAMMMAIAPSPLSADRVRALLENTAIPLNSTTTMVDVAGGVSGKPWDDHFGFGLINPVGAIVAAKGTTASGTNHLNLSTSVIAFGPLGSNAMVIASGSNGTPVTNITPTVSTAAGGNWLRVSTSSALSPARLNITIDRTGLADGTYSGTVSVASSAGSQNVAVSMSVSSTQTSGDSIENLRRAIENLTGLDPRASSQDIGTMIVSLLDADNPDVEVYYTKTDYQADYRFLMGVQPGRYYLRAYVDVDDEPGIGPDDLTFAYPNLTSPRVIQVDAGTNRTSYVLGQ